MNYEPWSSTPGETPVDLSGLTAQAKKTVRTQHDLDRVEAENILRASIEYLATKPSAGKAPFHDTWSLTVHYDMFCDVWEWAGQPRQHQINIGVHFHNIRPNLLDLFNDLTAWTETGMTLIEQATRLHHRAVQIHPFKNGNGRWARMLANIWLKRNAAPVVMWPTSVSRTSPIRDAYLLAVQAADGGDYAELIRMHEQHAE